MKKSPSSPYDFLYRHHGFSWLAAELWQVGRDSDRTEQRSVESIAKIDAAVAELESRGPEPRASLIAAKHILELKSEVLQFWGGIIANSTSLVSAGMAVFAVILAGKLSMVIAFFAFVFASLGLLTKVEIERRRTWVHLQLLSVKRRLEKLPSNSSIERAASGVRPTAAAHAERHRHAQ
jgi:hypothetical protein